MTRLANIVSIARREYTVRVRTRSFLVGTLLLLVAVSAIAFVPVIVRFFEGAGQTSVAVYVAAPDVKGDPVRTLSGQLNAAAGAGTSSGTGIGGGGSTPSRFNVQQVTDLAAGRREVKSGRFSALLEIDRPGAGSDLTFTLYADDSTTRTSQLIQQAASLVAIFDRLDRAGLNPLQQAGLFQPPRFSVAFPDPSRTDVPKSRIESGTDYLLGFGMTILVFMMVILYGNWVAASVVEEKSSRVMEVILNAATPFQLLTGKVLGVGAVALTQYLALIVVGVAAMAVQGPVAGIVLGSGGAGAALPSGLTVGALLVLATFGILGFLLYAVLYAASGSLVSRQEDLQQAVMPMALVSMVGYLVAVYTATGMLDLRAGWNAVLAQVPFFSPFLMLTRYTSGQASTADLVLAAAILGVSIVGALWIAARIYAVGVLLYGQRPGIRTVWRLLRQGI